MTRQARSRWLSVKHRPAISAASPITTSTLPTNEQFSVFDPAVYGERYGGVAFATTGVPEPSTWGLMLIGFAGLGFAAWRRARTAAASN